MHASKDMKKTRYKGVPIYLVADCSKKPYRPREKDKTYSIEGKKMLSSKNIEFNKADPQF